MTFSKRHILGSAWLGALALALATAGVPSASGQPEVESAGIVTPDTDGGAAPLLEQARTRGQVRLIVGLREAFVAEAGLAASAASAQRARFAATQRAVLAALATRRAETGAAAGAGPRNVSLFQTIPFLALEADLATIRSLLEDPRVASVHEDVAVPPTLNQSVPLIRADQAAALGFTGAGQTVAILDTGMAKAHPMLKGKVVSEACYSSTVAGRSTSLCPGGAQSSTASGSGKPCPLGDCFHGTHVASIAAGNTTSLKGVARGAKVISIQVFSNVGGVANAYFSDIMRGLERVYALRETFKIASANLSLGGSLYASSCDAALPGVKAIIDTLRAAKIATVIASGNDGRNGLVSAPGCISTAVTVGSTTKTDKVSSFSNHAKLVDLLAPGSDIYAAVPGGYARLSGTSMATPHVAGAWAVLKQGKPTASAQEIQDALACTGIPLTRAGIAKPRIDVLAALNVLRSTAPGCR
jgi:subtilisin